MCMKKKLSIIPALLVCIAFTACKKLPLQEGYDYTPSHYDNKLNKSVVDFMKSRPDLFSGMLAAIDYVDTDPAYKDIKPLYAGTGNTFLLLTNNALTELETDSTSFFTRNKIPNPGDPSKPFSGTSWTQYDKKVVADLLRYHILKGRQDYSSITSKPVWLDTYLTSEASPMAKIYVYMKGDRDGHLFLNNFVNFPHTWYVETKPRTPNLQATNAPVHVMDKYLIPPSKAQFDNNK